MQVQVLSPAIALLVFCCALTAAEPLQPGFRRYTELDEQAREEWHEGCRIFLNFSEKFDPNRPTQLVIYATPNGNTIEQTLGSEMAEGLDWHYDIQHVAAQIRKYRDAIRDAAKDNPESAENVVLAVVEAHGLSWPAYRSKYKDNSERIRKLVEGMVGRIPGKKIRVTLTGHSGGGSFTTGFLNAHEIIPDYIERIAYLDSNYSYSDDEKHGDKLLTWLKDDAHRRLIVIAYDDREITLNGKKVVGPTGGTWRATQRMIDRFGKNVKFDTATDGDFEILTAHKGQVLFQRHLNPQNKILHTALVGELNGLLEAMTLNRNLEWGKFGGKRAYTKWRQPAPMVPEMPREASVGSILIKRLTEKTKSDREVEIFKMLYGGLFPAFERNFVTVTAKRKDKAGKEHTISFDVMPDYLALGNDTDFLRMPMTPQTATRIAEAWGCTLPTAAMVNMIHEAATVKLEPKPLGEPRETVEQFANHNAIIEEQRKGKKLGELVSGIKKDIVWSNRIAEKPRRLALYGWHKLDGTPIQPLTIVHVDTYVDYSHGVRLVKRTIQLDGKPKDIRDIVRDPNLAPLLSDEGVLTIPGYE